MNIYEEQQKIIKESKVRILVTSKISGLFGIDIYIPSDKGLHGNPFARVKSTLTIKGNTYEEALRQGIEFYKSIKNNIEDYV